MASVEILDAVKFEVTVDEAVKTARLVAKHTKRSKVRTALRVMLRELRKGNKELVTNVLEPLYALDSEAKFAGNFGKIRARFKSRYLQPGAILFKINCDKVTMKLRQLQEAKLWQRRMPILRRSLSRLKLLTEDWVENDGALYEADRRIQASLNEFLDAVAEELQNDPKAAYANFRDGLADMESHFLELRDQIGEIDLLIEELSS